MVYLDDILPFSQSPEQHAEHPRLILAKPRVRKLYAKRSRCKSALKLVNFLGHVVDAAGSSPDLEQVQVVQDWPVHKDIKQLRHFIGLAQYHRRFMQGFASQVAKLSKLLRKNAKWQWTTCMEVPSHGCVGVRLHFAPSLSKSDPHKSCSAGEHDAQQQCSDTHLSMALSYTVHMPIMIKAIRGIVLIFLRGKTTPLCNNVVVTACHICARLLKAIS